MHPLVVTGNDTGIGKTVVSAILTLALDANYWKPVQSGDLHASDSMAVQALTGLGSERILPEAFRLSQPLSPHASAAIDEVEITKESLSLPPSSRSLVIEGAGGPLAPLSLQLTQADVFAEWRAEAIFVVKHYLGSINHTLCGLETLRQRGVIIRGVVYNGKSNPASEAAIEAYGKVSVLGRVREEPELTQLIIRRYAEQWQSLQVPA